MKTRQVGLKHVMAPTFTKLGELATKLGDSPRASSLLADGLKLTRELGDRVILANSLDAVATLAIRIGQVEEALRMAAAADKLRKVIGVQASPGDQEDLEGSLAAVRDSLGPAAADAAWRQGQSLPVDTIIFGALEILARVTEPVI